MLFRSSATDEQIAAAETKAESILAEFKAGAATEDFFAELANKYSEDTGSNTTGGLYSGISPSSSYVPEFLEWSVDASRQVGETGIVQTDFGFHIMFFNGVDGVEWKINVENTLVSEKYSTYISDLAEETPYEWVKLGARLVG